MRTHSWNNPLGETLPSYNCNSHRLIAVKQGTHILVITDTRRLPPFHSTLCRRVCLLIVVKEAAIELLVCFGERCVLINLLVVKVLRQLILVAFDFLKAEASEAATDHAAAECRYRPIREGGGVKAKDRNDVN